MGAAVLASLLVVGAAQAAAPHSKAVLSAYADSAAGESLLAGHYTEVIERLGSHGNEFASDQVGASTNLCVALIMTRQLQAAHSACDEAIEDAKLDVTEETIAARTTHDEEVALAYSNRAVLEWLSDHRTAAADDLSRARAFAPASEFVTQNLTALRASGTPAPAVAAAHG
ncbi:MAG TPA: hypothetical protein VMU67_15975 [Steroidobacteraceae bacterium]|nr:hypothetical protein [Steroidobacteraceae bacterium]